MNTMDMMRCVLRDEADANGGVGGGQGGSDNLLNPSGGAGETTAWVNDDGALSEGWQARLGAGYDGLGKFKSVDSLAKSYAELERMKGAPGEGATPEELARWDAVLGVPADESGYNLRDAVGVQEGEGWDEELEKIVTKAAKENHVPPAALQSIVKAQAEYERQQAAARVEEQKAAVARGHEALKGYWGAEYEKRLGMAKHALPGLAQELGLDLDGPEARVVLSSPFVVKLLHRVASLQASDNALGRGLPPGSGGVMTREEATRIMTDTAHPQHAAYRRGDVDVCNAVHGAFGRRL